MLQVELRNPLQLDLNLTCLRLTCTWEPPTTLTADSPRGTVAPSAAGNPKQQEEGFQVGHVFLQVSCGDTFAVLLLLLILPIVVSQVLEENITLCAGEQRIAHLRVVPLNPGLLHISGLTWVLNDVAHGRAAFRETRICRHGGSNA